MKSDVCCAGAGRDPRAVLFKPNPPEASDMLCEAAMRFVAGSNLVLKNQSFRQSNHTNECCYE